MGGLGPVTLNPQLIDQFALAFVQGGYALHTRLIQVSNSLYGSLLLMTLSWLVIQMLLDVMIGEEMSALLGKLIRYLLMAGLVGWFMQAYDLVFYQGVYQGCEAVAQAIAGTGNTAQGFTTAWSVYSDILVTIWQAMTLSPQHYFNGATPLSWAFWSAVGAWLVTMFLFLLVVLILLMGLLVFAVVHVMGSALTGIALAFGPFFIPWFLWDFTKNYFFGWVRFLLTSCFIKVVAIAVLAMTKPVFQEIHLWVVSSQQTLTTVSATDSMVLAVMLVVVCGMVTYLMAHVPQIASALMGHGRVDTGLAGVASRQIQKSIGQANGWLSKQTQQTGSTGDKSAKSSQSKKA